MFSRKPVTLLLYLTICQFVANSQTIDPPFLKYLHHPWVDSVINTLTTDQKIAQSIWIAAWSNKDSSHINSVSETISKYGIGGLIFFQGSPEKQALLINYYQKISKVPLITAMDAEWGVGMRLDKAEKFPFQLTLGAIRNDSPFTSSAKK